MFFWRSDPADGTNPAPVTVATGVGPGQTATYVLSQLGAPFFGYTIAVCGFQMGHGFAFISNPTPGVGGGAIAQGYLALSITSPRLSAAVTTGVTESRGH